MSETNQPLEPVERRGLRWLTVFEQAMSALVVAAVLGIGSILFSVNSMNDKLIQLVVRLDRLEAKSDERQQRIDVRVRTVESDVSDLKARVGSLERSSDNG